MAAYTVQTIRCILIISFIYVQLSHGLYYESMLSKTCMRRLPFRLKRDSIKEAKVCPFKSLELNSRMSSRNNPQVRKRRSLLLPGLPLLPLLLPPIIPKLPLLPLPILPPPLLTLPKLKKPLKPLKVPILGKRSVFKVGSKLKPIKVPGLDLKAGKRRILNHLTKLKRKGSLSTAEYFRFRKLLLR